MECKKQGFFVILDHFLPFYKQKIKILQKWKKSLEILSFYKCIPWQSYDIWFLRYGVQQTYFFVILDCFLPFYNQKIKILTKWKKQKQKAWRDYHFTHDVSYDILFLRNGVQWMDFFVILGYLLPFYPSNNPKTQLKKVKMSGDIIILHTYQKWQPYDVWFLRYGVQRIELFVILDHFLPFYPANNPENQNLEKIKKKLEILFYTCTINDNHMMNGSWYMTCDGWHFLLFWPIFCPCAPLRTQIKIKKKNEKSTGRYHHFTHAYLKWRSYYACFLRYWSAMDKIFCHFLTIFWPFTSLKNRKSKFWKNFKKCLEMLSSYTYVHH